MLRRKPKRATRAPQPSGWAVMRIDNHPIRDKARRAYQKALRELNQVRLQIEQFEKTDRPQFQQWLNRECGALVTEVRETTGRFQSKRALLLEIQSEAILSDCSHPRAYERVMRRKEESPEPESDPGAERRNHGKQGAGGADPFSDFFRGADPGIPSGDKPGAHPAHESPRLKELYRALVRRLHPDTQGTMTAQRKDWWHQAQAAYNRGDVEQLELLLTLCEIDDHGTTTRTSVSLLIRITRQFRNSLRTLRFRLSGYRDDPAWNFSQVRDRAPLLERAERLLQAELFDLKRALAAVEAQLESWARQARAVPPPGGGRRFGPRPGEARF